jgi:type IV pilus assembly protein PilW
MKALTKDGNGFTLIELLVAMVIGIIVLSGIYAAYRKQLGIYVVQKQIVEMQQKVRYAMYSMSRSIRMTGFDPQRTDLFGFVANFSAPYDSMGATTDVSHIAFALDNDEDGILDPNELELVAYRLNGDRLQKLTFGAGSPPIANWETVSENIDALNFVYMDGNDPPNILAPPLSAAALDQIRSVQITVVARSGDNPSFLGNQTTDNRVYRNQQGTVIFDAGSDKFRRISLSTQANCRNAGL